MPVDAGTSSAQADEAIRALVVQWTQERETHFLRSWISRTATLSLWRAGPQRIVVKRMASAENAERLYHLMTAFSNAPRGPEDVHRLPAIGWSADLCSVGMPYVDAPSLAELLKQRWLSWRAPSINALAASVGRALGCFHGVAPTAAPAARSAADKKLTTTLRGVGHSASVLRRAADESCPVRSYLDINPSHVLVEPSGTVCLIDVPSKERFVHLHHDIAFFHDKLFTDLVKSAPRVPAMASLARFSALRSSFFDAYCTYTRWVPSDTDKALVVAFEAFMVGRRVRKSREREYGATVTAIMRARESRLRASLT